MNDRELDRLLDSWQAPAPPPSLRDKVRARFPRTERRAASRPWRWVLAAGVAFAMLTVAMGQSNDTSAGARIAQALAAFWDHIAEAFDAHRVAALTGQILSSEPHVLIDGNAGPALERVHAASLVVTVPGDGQYWINFYPKPLQGWIQAGRIKETYLEFEAGSHHVVVACNRRLMMSDAPIQVRRRETN